MPLGTEWPCPHSGDACMRYCPQTACSRDLDEASWPDCEPDPMDLGETVPWPMGPKCDVPGCDMAAFHLGHHGRQS